MVLPTRPVDERPHPANAAQRASTCIWRLPMTRQFEFYSLFTPLLHSLRYVLG